MEEYEMEQDDGWRAWRSDAAYPVLAIELDAGESRTVRIKDIAVLKGKPYDKEAPYRYMDGTSMASPAAAWSLALLAAIRPELTPDELRADNRRDGENPVDEGQDTDRRKAQR